MLWSVGRPDDRRSGHLPRPAAAVRQPVGPMFGRAVPSGVGAFLRCRTFAILIFWWLNR